MSRSAVSRGAHVSALPQPGLGPSAAVPLVRWYARDTFGHLSSPWASTLGAQLVGYSLADLFAAHQNGGVHRLAVIDKPALCYNDYRRIQSLIL